MNLKTVEAMTLYEFLKELIPTSSYGVRDPWKEQQLKEIVQLFDAMFVKHLEGQADADNK